MHRIRSAMLLLSLIAGAPLVAQDTPAAADPATALVVGTVIDAVTGTPISGAIVSLAGSASVTGASVPAPPAAPTSVLTAGDGRFLITRLKAGRYSAACEKAGYLNGGLFAERPGTPTGSVALVPGEHRTDLVIRLWRLATIGGTVIDETGEPAVGLDVRILRRDLQSGRASWMPVGSTTRTDDRGVFRVAGLTPGDYVAFIPVTQATLPTSVLENYQKESSAQSDTYRQLMSEMFRPGAILSPSGPGVPNVQQVGDNALSTGDGMPVPSDSTGAPTFAYATTYYPSAASIAGATVIKIDAGSERYDVNFQLRPVRTIRITGTLVGPDGPIGFTRVSLAATSTSSMLMDLDAAATITDGSGTFTLLNVPQGQYALRVLRVPRQPNASAGVATVVQTANGTMTMTMSGGSSATAPLPADPVLWAEVPVIAGDDDIRNLIVTARPGIRVQGRVEFIGDAQKPDEKQMAGTNVRITTANNRVQSGMAMTRVSSTGELTSQGYAAGRYFVAASTPMQGWTLASSMHDGIDVSQVPLELSSSDVSDLIITFTDKKTDVSGVLRDVGGKPDTNLAVVFPADAPIATDDVINPRRVRAARASSNGKFTFLNLPPGEYFVTGLPADDMRWSDPQVLESLKAQAVRVRVAYGQPATVDAVTRKVR